MTAFTERMKKGFPTLMVGVALFVVGAIALPLALILFLISTGPDEQQFIVPGTADFEITRTGRYYLWNDYQTVFGSRTFNRQESLPDGFNIKVSTDKDKKLVFTGDASISSSRGATSRKSIGYVEITTPGRVTVAVSGDSDPRVFSFSKSILLKMLALCLGGFGLCALLALAGLGISAWGIVKLVRKQ